eukprot:GFUD01004551.1.p1 GENE.GFUD01004551.1~~GFUD01004551.1.p1  ORF type:complete len:520 (+),score=94.91 GFUD01004551.1:217-1560(+)
MATLSWVFTAYPVSVQYAALDQRNLTNITTDIDTPCNDSFLGFDSSVREDSIVLDLNLLCGREWLKSLLAPVYMVGMLIGAPVFGFLSDKFGRKRLVLVSISVVSISGCVLTVMPQSLAWHAFWRFLTGFGAGGAMVCTFVYLIEGPRKGRRWRLIAALGLHLGWNSGQIVLVTTAYLVRGWRELQLLTHAGCLLALSLHFLVPESPRWLICQGRLEEAKQVIMQMASTNRKTVPFDVLDSLVQPPIMQTGKIPKVLIKRLLVLSFQWFATNLCYYGIHYSSAQLYGDIYINFPLLMLAEVSANLFSHLVALPSLGRRRYLSLCQLLCSLVLLLSSALSPSYHQLKICLTLIGKFTATANFNCLYFYTCELFPTSIRSTTIGVCSTLGRLGAVVALACVHLNWVSEYLPPVIMAAPAGVAALLMVALPETEDCNLPESLEETIVMIK